jgi:starch synthase
MRIVMITSELATFAGTGGLGEAVLALSKGLRALGHEVAALLPLYGVVDRGARAYEARAEKLEIDLGGRRIEARLIEAGRGDPDDPRVLLVDQPGLFDRPHLYGPPYGAYADNAERFAFLANAALRAIDMLGLAPDIVHVHDWPLGLVPVFLALAGDRARKHRSVLTVHNLAFQGLFDLEKARALGIPARLLVPNGLEFYQRLSFLKGGISFADLVTTVSPSYAKEILTEAGGMGLDGVLRERRQDLVGIVNGIDTALWDPERDRGLPERFRASDRRGKAACKAAAQEALELPLDAKAMLCAVVSRFTSQKGLDLVAEVATAIAHRPIQIAIHGSGDPHLEALLCELARVHPQRIAVRLGYDGELARLLFAGADAVLVPSRFEPCGLSQLYGLRYGALPIVRATGGLKDTVVEIEKDPDLGNGFVFDGLGAPPFIQAILRAEDMYRRPEAWAPIVDRAMREDHSAVRAAREYSKAYERALEFPPHRPHALPG